MLKLPDSSKFIVIAWSIGCACLVSTGCQRHAYTDLYAESMASEIRTLEDRIYEYDAAYQGIEDELAGMQSENDRLHEQLGAMRAESTRSSPSSRSLFKGSNDAPMRIAPTPDPTPSFHAPSSKSLNSNPTPSVGNLPPSTSSRSTNPAQPRLKPDDQDLEPPKIEIPKQRETIPPTSIVPTLPTVPSSPAVKPSEGDSFLPPPLKNPPTTMQAFPDSLEQASIDEGKIDLPSTVQPASYVGSVPASSSIHSSSGLADGNFASVTTNAPAIDRKVIEIAFHPTLCRGQNTGSNAVDDGLFLVLQPRNATGDILDQAASLTIVAVDPNRPSEQSKIARWILTAEEVDAVLEPIGLGHGYHIALPWQATKPIGDTIQVYVRYEMLDGRRLVNERRIHLHVPSTGSATWTPRVAK